MADGRAILTTVVVAVIVVAVGVTVLAIFINQCLVGAGDSVHVQVDSIHLSSHPTDNVLFGWESIFGKPSDEISVKIQSGFCKASNHPEEIKEGQTINFGSTLSINTFFHMGFSFWLEESDSFFEGSDDYSKTITVSGDKVDRMREAFDNGLTDNVKLDYAVTVKGANIFQENKWFGFIAENLCVSALDFLAGPWTSKAVGKAILFKSGDMARLYKTVGKQFQQGMLTKKSLFKSLLAYQIRAGAKSAVLNPVLGNMNDLVKEWALNQTTLDEKINETVTALKEGAIFAVAGQEGLDLYRDVNEELARWAGYMEKLTDSLEFCLSEVLPPSTDALYHVTLTVTR